ncbi:lectizyme [Drosophila takahashii]|uniref:lectizyme n=1 Tax=Drosophila takahashii TaxID=29030 RepID=UPI001CF834FC|nr:lectizyme [Drosophila takahashii]
MRQFVVLFALAVVASVASANLIPQPGFPEGRVINGQEAERGEAPYIVSLQTTSGSHFCGGSLINDHTVLTAAHCLTNSQGRVVAGIHGRLDQEGVQTRSFTNAQYRVHEDYSGGVGPNDIGLILLSEPFDLTAVARDGSNPVGVVSLPSKTFTGTGTGFLYGLGRDNTGSLATNLQKLETKIIDYEACKEALPSNAPLATTNVCSYTANKADGACNGDSGGPLVMKSDIITFLIGIVSWGYTPCMTTTNPSVYTDVAAFTDWIEKNQE